jgi:zinc protease
MGRDLGGLLHGGDGRWTFPGRQQIAGLPGPLKTRRHRSAGGRLHRGGDGRRHHGRQGGGRRGPDLRRPAGPPADTPLRPARDAPFPGPSKTPVVRTHKGRADQGQLFIAWKTDDLFSDLQRARNTQVLAQVMQLRLTDELREKQGATYSPSASATASVTFAGWGYLAVSVETPPDKIDGGDRQHPKIAADLRDKPITADELDRAKKPRIDQIEKARETNEYWLGSLSGAQTDPRLLTATRSVIAGLQRVKAADVQTGGPDLPGRRQVVDDAGQAGREVDTKRPSRRSGGRA